MATKKELFPDRENKIETKFCEQIKKLGGEAIKMNQGAGMPDRLVLYKGWAGFVECKRLGLWFGKKQRYRRKQLERLGFNVSLIDSADAISDYVLKLYMHGKI